MNTMILIVSYLLFVAASVAPLTYLVYEVRRLMLAGKPWLTRHTAGFAAVTILSTLLEIILRVAMTHLEIPALMALASGVFAALISAALWWVYDAVRVPVVVSVITQPAQPAPPVLGETELELRKAVAAMTAPHMRDAELFDEIFIETLMIDALPGTASPYNTLPIVEMVEEASDEQ